MAKRTKGFCKFCGKEYTRSGMVKHIATCKERSEENGQTTTKKENYFELLIQAKYNSDYWLLIQMKETKTLKDLDQFIRDIWVECCGHLSCFDIYGECYESVPGDDFWKESSSRDMKITLKKVLSEGMVFTYEYDYGSTTELICKVIRKFKDVNRKETCTILSRNNPPEYLCCKCGKTASWINVYNYYDEDAFWCNECKKSGRSSEWGEHDKDEYDEDEYDEEFDEDELDEDEYDEFDEEFARICNSPRMGVCGYDGISRYPEVFEPDKK